MNGGVINRVGCSKCWCTGRLYITFNEWMQGKFRLRASFYEAIKYDVSRPSF
jgi:hypothetical protein